MSERSRLLKLETVKWYGRLIEGSCMCAFPTVDPCLSKVTLNLVDVSNFIANYGINSGLVNGFDEDLNYNKTFFFQKGNLLLP